MSTMRIQIYYLIIQNGLIVIEDKQEYKQPPYLNIEPDWYESSIDGFPCNCCGESCLQYDNCNKEQRDE